MSILGVLFGLPDDEWVKDAVCPTTDADAFFPDAGVSAKAARNICLTCPVRCECLAYAMEHDIKQGVWGSFTERDRMRLNRGENPLPRKHVDRPTPRRANGHSIACRCCRGAA